MRDPYERLRDVQETIMHILKYTSQGSDLFYHDELVQTWVIHLLSFRDFYKLFHRERLAMPRVNCVYF